jgi:hypothetical protein
MFIILYIPLIAFASRQVFRSAHFVILCTYVCNCTMIFNGHSYKNFDRSV